MKKIILILILLIFINPVSAQEVCEYNGIKTEYGYNYQEPGAKAEYGDEKFIHIVDAKAVKNLEQLKGLTCLEFADFYNQGVFGGLENLRNLINLKVLNLHTNPMVYGDVCAFSKATELKSLKLAFDEKVYGDISCLKDLNLDTFAMTYTRISGELSDLSHMTNLKALYLSGTNITGDISALSGLTNLEELTLSDAEMDGLRFYGDLASLDNLKKLRRAALYNMNIINCEHFHEEHPNIEGGCSDESKSAVTNTNTESEKIIGKGAYDDIPKGDGLRKPAGDKPPPEECVADGKFIGENECRALVDKASLGKPASDRPLPEECMLNGEFIGENECRALVDKMGKPAGERPPEECIMDGNFIGEAKCRDLVAKMPLAEETKPQETAAKKSFLQKVIGWLNSLFR